LEHFADLHFLDLPFLASWSSEKIVKALSKKAQYLGNYIKIPIGTLKNCNKKRKNLSRYLKKMRFRDLMGGSDH
jgi:hypothetical protein